jgi:hypothetical protein
MHATAGKALRPFSRKNYIALLTISHPHPLQ